jgi:predicted transcriptional regulator YdeE
METLTEISSKKIVGVELRTTSDNGVAFDEIPPFWQKFFKESILEKIPNKLSKDIFAVYTNFENEGKNNEGQYSLIIGASVELTQSVPDGFVSTVVPNSTYQVFNVETGHPEKVGNKWQEIWKHKFNKKRTFLSEYEHYKESGEINIYIGVH